MIWLLAMFFKLVGFVRIGAKDKENIPVCGKQVFDSQTYKKYSGILRRASVTFFNPLRPIVKPC
jgi:hypothetical protein